MRKRRCLLILKLLQLHGNTLYVYYILKIIWWCGRKALRLAVFFLSTRHSNIWASGQNITISYNSQKQLICMWLEPWELRGQQYFPPAGGEVWFLSGGPDWSQLKSKFRVWPNKQGFITWWGNSGGPERTTEQRRYQKLLPHLLRTFPSWNVFLKSVWFRTQWKSQWRDFHSDLWSNMQLLYYSKQAQHTLLQTNIREGNLLLS